MKILQSKKGSMLITAYLVLFVIVVVAGSIFNVVLSERKQIERESEGVKAINYAEMGLSYAYYESQNLGWQWYTHKWNENKDKLIPLEPSDPGFQQKLRDDCSFDADGFYVENNGKFMIKAYPHPDDDSQTTIVSMGASGNYQKALKFNLSRQGIYDFFYFSPYSVDLDNAVGNFPKLNGGSIHSNGDIYFDGPVRLENISEMSTGREGTIYYRQSDQYPAPHYLDEYDGVSDGKAPIVRLDKYWDVFRDDDQDNPGEFGYYYNDKYGNRLWSWKSQATYYANTTSSEWPTKGWRDTEYYFYGNNQPWNDIRPGWKDTQVSSSIINDNTINLNKHNVWVKPYKGVDGEGNIISDPWTQIPAELDQSWDWGKYKYRRTTENPVTFYTYDNDGNKVDVEDTYWDIVNEEQKYEIPERLRDLYKRLFGIDLPEYFIWYTQNFTMVDPDELGDYPGAKNYWDTFKDPDYWNVIGRSPYSGYNWVDNLDTGIFDGNYGDEIGGSGGTIPVNITNSQKQPEAWESFLEESGLATIVRDGSTGGEDLEPPEFDITYARLAERGGILIDLTSDFDGEYNDYDEWQQVLERSIDEAVERFNAGGANLAKKVKFINTFTGKWNVVLEIDLKLMQNSGTYPNNGILYSKVPLRFTNAAALPRKMANYGFTVLGEENIYLKGDYNVDEWVTSAIISKKRVFALSDDFNDPQYKPATEHYRDYPYMCVKKDPTSGQYIETRPDDGDGIWVYRDRLNHPIYDYYTQIDDANEQVLRDMIGVKDAQFRAMFNKKDPTGKMNSTFTWAPSGESYTYGMRPNVVNQDHTYNALIACNRGVKGDTLENWRGYDYQGDWYSRRKNLNGAFFVLDKDSGFTAPSNMLVDYEPWREDDSQSTYLGLDRRERKAPGMTYDYARFGVVAPYAYLGYDVRFKTATRSPSDVFFGGAQSLWLEASPEFFYQMAF